jgi:hypothetical protein
MTAINNTGGLIYSKYKFKHKNILLNKKKGLQAVPLNLNIKY